jgi:hypothetical protein
MRADRFAGMPQFVEGDGALNESLMTGRVCRPAQGRAQVCSQ